MKNKLIAIAALVAAGLLVTLLTVSNYASIANTYNTNLEKARANAQKEIPYNAYRYYKEAFAVRCDDENIYKEYLAQALLLGGDYYTEAVEEYVTRFPDSPEAYELMCEVHYSLGSYKSVLETALEAREKEIATERVRDLYNECAFMLETVMSGFEEAQSFLGGVARVKVNGLYGYVQSFGSYLLAPVYEQASTMMSGSAAVHDGEEWHIVNSIGFKVARTSVPADYLGIMVGGKIPVAKDGKYAYTNGGLVLPEEMPYDYASNFKNGVAAVMKGGKWALINAEEQPITDYVFDGVLLDEYDTCCNGGVIFVLKDGKYYMASPDGNKITEQAFDDARPFAGSEPAAVCIGGKWGFVNTAGEMVIEPQYSDARSFNVGLGAVCVEGKWGYINSSGTIRIECQFNDCKPFNAEGIAAVQNEEGLWEYVQLLSYEQ